MKKLFALLFAASVLTLTSCGDKKAAEGSEDTTATIGSESDVTTEETVTEDTAAISTDTTATTGTDTTATAQ